MQHKCYALLKPILAGMVLALSSISSAQQYDIYVYDVKTHEVNRATNIPGAGCFNVSWNNNGKKIAHDVVGGPSYPYDQSVFITDLTTGISSPLTGAEGGNDPSWSPDGNTIAFDVWEFDYYYWTVLDNLYMVPAGGGNRTFIRQHSGHGSWSPNGSRIAFADNWYGYIGTKNLSTGQETFVAYGNWPTWSPNGQYIAFNGYSGGVWVIQVDPNGNPVGNPTQLSATGYGPTWSNNSKSVVYIDWPGGDPDLYSIPVTGGTAQRVTGRTGGFDMGDYDPSFSNNGKSIAWSQFTEAPSTAARGAADNTIKDDVTVMKGNFPNPFTTQTSIQFELSKDNHVKLVVFDLMGKEVKVLANADYKKGTYHLSWNGKNAQGQTLSSGTYIIRLITPDKTESKMMQLVK